MKIQIASHLGMCFGVRDALRTAHHAAAANPVTILGQLVHNPEVDRLLATLGVRHAALSGPANAPTAEVVITAHGAADHERQKWRQAGFRVTDTTCPLVRKAHDALALLVREKYRPVVIGQVDHAEVRGLVGDFPGVAVVLKAHEIEALAPDSKFGVISQTTQPLDLVLDLVARLKRAQPAAEVRFIDTVCHPTKQRQDALVSLCRDNQLIVVIGGRNSNNTRQLAEKVRQLGRDAIQVESAADLRPEWFRRIASVGVTAGTSTLDETVDAVVAALRKISADLAPSHELLRLAARFL